MKFLASIFLSLALVGALGSSTPSLAKDNAGAKPPAEDSAAEGRGKKPWSKIFAFLETNKGTIKIRLFHRQTPKTVANFIGLAEGTRAFTDVATKKQVTRPFYDNLVFHRVIPNYIVQTGDPLENGRGGPGYAFPDEFHSALKHNKPGIVSMANSGPNRNGSQFFITLKPIPDLDYTSSRNIMNKGGNTIFGEVLEGMDVVTAISSVARDPFDKPLEPVVLKRIVIVREL
ncbi:MAG: peptidylprolyl isomerase [Bdellovibrionales bacterium]|nr:peptidylprolyl isomerase [Bdellovibrionales bacterium]